MNRRGEGCGILAALYGYAASRPVRAHTPGHKADADFRKLFPCAALDITELSFSDNLSSPAGVIRDAEERAAAALGAKRSFFLTDGSTSGVHAMLAAVRERGNKILVNRNAHRSVYDACALFGTEPFVLPARVREGMVLPPTAEEIARALDEAGDGAIGALLTCPDYYGNAADLGAAKEVLRERGKLLLVDGAQGGHLRFDRGSVYAGEYADVWVDGAHKTMPALTQGAILSAGNEDLVAPLARAVCRVRTSSPNYLILASLEYAVAFMEREGAARLAAVRREAEIVRNRLEGEGFAFYPSADPLRIVVDLRASGIRPDAADAELERRGVYAEMNDGRYLLFLLSPLTSRRDLGKISGALLGVKKTCAAGAAARETRDPAPTFGRRAVPYSAAIAGERESVPLRAAAGRIAAENVGLFPPCFPLAVAGEELTEEVVETLLAAKGTFGINCGAVDVLKTGDGDGKRLFSDDRRV